MKLLAAAEVQDVHLRADGDPCHVLPGKHIPAKRKDSIAGIVKISEERFHTERNKQPPSL